VVVDVGEVVEYAVVKVCTVLLDRERLFLLFNSIIAGAKGFVEGDVPWRFRDVIPLTTWPHPHP